MSGHLFKANKMVTRQIMIDLHINPLKMLNKSDEKVSTYKASEAFSGAFL